MRNLWPRKDLYPTSIPRRSRRLQEERGFEALYLSLDEGTALREHQQTSPFLLRSGIWSTFVICTLGNPWDELWHDWREDWRYLRFDVRYRDVAGQGAAEKVVYTAWPTRRSLIADPGAKCYHLPRWPIRECRGQVS